MSDDEETVADVLADAGLDDEHTFLYQLVNGNADPDEADYEMWVQPLKLTGGRVCLREDDPTHPKYPTFWYTIRNGDTLVGRRLGRKEVVGKMAIRWLQAADPTTLTPVLREDTPFAEGGADDG